MRDIVQASVTIFNPFTNTISGGSFIKPIVPDYTDDGFLDENGYLYADSELFDSAELFAFV